MIPFLEHPWIYSLLDWILVAIAVVSYFHTTDFTDSPEHKDLDTTWKIITALMWPACLVIFIVVVPLTMIGTLFTKKPDTKPKKD